VKNEKEEKLPTPISQIFIYFSMSLLYFIFFVEWEYTTQIWLHCV